jgi:hypothetical protein
LHRHALEVREHSRDLFWNKSTGRFGSGIDIDGKLYDYGFTFINCEAIHYDFASKEQAASILSWLSGERLVEGDTSQGKDIYHWRFGPRSTTKRNIEYYGWFWNGPETIPWGGQVQDGGAVLGFSYHDLMSRLSVRGPDDAWARLEEVIRWYDEVQAAGGYREYYKDGSRGSLQGGGTPGGLGLDKEFFESILVPQVMLAGFLGFSPTGEGFRIDPRIPSDWPSLEVNRIHLHDVVLAVKTDGKVVTVKREGKFHEPPTVRVRGGPRRIIFEDRDGKSVGEITPESLPREGPEAGWVPFQWKVGERLRILRP